jgi:putative ABC transport system ATP-binding protein
MSDSFILCENLVKIFQVAGIEMVALQGLNLTIEKGELVGIIGSSGSGKSTLMNILGGLDRPTAGRVRVDGHDLLKMPDRLLNRYRREKVGFVWQQSTRNLVPYLNAVQNVMLPMTLNGVTGKEKKRRAEELLDIVGLGQRKHHHLPELSGGEQQRVAIAVGLANSPTLLLADEPTGEVDTATAMIIYRTFQTLTRELNITTLIVSHDPTISRHVDRVVGIRDGTLASETIRQSQIQNDTNGETVLSSEQDEDHHYSELVVLDRAGRLHIPHEYLEQFDISGRAQLEITEDGILIRPAIQTQTAQVKIENGDENGAPREKGSVMPRMSHAGAMAVQREKTAGGLKGFFGRFGKKEK